MPGESRRTKRPAFFRLNYLLLGGEKKEGRKRKLTFSGSFSALGNSSHLKKKYPASQQISLRPSVERDQSLKSHSRGGKKKPQRCAASLIFKLEAKKRRKSERLIRAIYFHTRKLTGRQSVILPTPDVSQECDNSRLFLLPCNQGSANSG